MPPERHYPGPGRRHPEAHIGHRWCIVIGGHPVDRVDDDGVGGLATAAKDPDRVEANALGHPVDAATDSAGHVGAMTITVRGSPAVIDASPARAHATTELVVTGTNTGVDDVGVHAGAGVIIVVGIIQGQIALVDAIQAPGCG